MAGTEQTSLYEVGYRRTILLFGAFWGAVPALGFGVSGFTGISYEISITVTIVLMTLSLGILFELDSRKLDQYGQSVPMAWAYALTALVATPLWTGLVRAGILSLIGILFGPPISVLLYLWQRGQQSDV